MNTPVVLYAEFTALPDHLPTAERLITDLARKVRAEPGNLGFDVYQLDTDRCRFLVFERYVDENAFRAHLAAPHGAAFNAALGDLIVEDASQLTFLHSTSPSASR